MLLIYFGNKFFVFFINDFFYLDIKLYCPVIPNIGPIVGISDPKHAKKNGRNSIFSGAQMSTFENSFLGLVMC